MSFVRKSKSDIVADMKLGVVENIPKITDLNQGGVLAEILDVNGNELSLIYDNQELIYNGTRIDLATGEDLDNIGAYVGITRNPGLKTAGYATFERNNPAGVNFTISAGAIISTQPNTADPQLKYVVRSNTTFSASISAEVHDYVDGVYDYPLNERIISSVSSIGGTVSGSPYVFVVTTDYTIEADVSITDIDVTSIVEVDDCDTADWTESTDASADATEAVDKRQGTASLKLGKSGTSSNTFSYEKVLSGSKNGSGKHLQFWMYINSGTDLSKIVSAKIIIGSGGSAANSYEMPISLSTLETGWKMYSLSYQSTTAVRVGTPSISAIDYVKIVFVTSAAGDTITSGNIKMDYWFFSFVSSYRGDIIRFVPGATLPDDGTTFSVDYIPLSKEVLVDAEEIGSDYNVGVNRIVYKVSIISNIDTVNNYVVFLGGLDAETDDDYRARIKEATTLAGKATTQALRQAILGVNGVTSVTIEDTPQLTETDETHVYNATTKEFKLAYEVAFDSATLKISDSSGGPADYIKGTDYRLDLADNKIKFDLAGAEPSGGATVYVDYEYLWNCHVFAYVTGAEIPLPSAVLTDVNTAIADTKAAGVVVTVFEPTLVSVDVTADITVDTLGGYSSSAVQAAVVAALQQHMNALDTGEDVYLSELYRVIQEVDGVINSSISAPAADVSIANAEVARPGTITITVI
jgi:uncharacterized phage protein gp47/JayE